MEWKCKKCGKCCEVYRGTLEANNNDIKRWRKEGRDDILERVLFMSGEDEWGDLWACDDGSDFGRCPFLNKDNTCAIQDTKPEVCANYTCEHEHNMDERYKSMGLKTPIVC